MFVVWAAGWVAAVGEVLLREATAAATAAVLPLLGAMLLRLLGAMEAVAAMVEATATHLALVATLGGKYHPDGFTIRPTRDSISPLRYPGTSCCPPQRNGLHFLVFIMHYFERLMQRSLSATTDGYGIAESHTPTSI